GGGEARGEEEATGRRPHSHSPPPLMSLLSRRSVKSSKLTRLPSKPGETPVLEGVSCPNSPAVKKVYRLVIVGAARTGKSSIVGRFLDKDHDERYIPTIENFHRKIYKIKGEIFQLDIVDTSGNDPFPAARKLSFISGDMFIIVSSADMAHSVAHAIDLKHQITECKQSRGVVGNGDVPCVFAFNKTDAVPNRTEIDEKEVAERLEEVFGHSDNLVACSAANNTNIDKVFGRVFSIGKCPKHMNPELHKMLRNELSADGDSKKKILQRMRSKFSRDGDDTLAVYTDVNARRPSLRTDLLMNRAKTSVVNAHTVGKAPPNYSTNNNEGDPQKCTIM
ncbi:hypothetical protein PENTCL1PPCAC_28430, partial [Pristionchus entomophagus]